MIYMQITNIHGREILDSRGNPTVEAEEMCIRDSSEGDENITEKSKEEYQTMIEQDFDASYGDTVPVTIEPVSYTHLDVYKRQGVLDMLLICFCARHK